jgi:alpha-glucosidase
MKSFIENIGGIEEKKDARGACSLVCGGSNGLIRLTVYSAKKILVSCDFDNISIHPVLGEAHRFLRGSPPVRDTSVSIREEETRFTIDLAGKEPDEKTLVVIEKKTGNVSFFHRGLAAQGAAIGNDDTVLPPSQALLVKENGHALPLFRFLFPLRDGDAFYGLGDKSGLPDRRNRRFRMFNRDALGYDAEISDPLYKSIPFFIKINRINNSCMGLYFPESLVEAFDFGRESLFYYKVEVKGGPAAYFVFLGNDYKDILYEYAEVTGFPALPPLYSFGFFGSSMNYVESNDAEKKILRYFDAIEKNGIPCEGMYLSSGYLKAGNGKRYSFLWNKRKFPDPAGFVKSLAARGYRLCMNIKPGILKSHPWYGEIHDRGLFITGKDGKACVEYYWGGEASFPDFSNPETVQWWKSRIKEAYLDNGCAGIWNDNNELELEDEELEAFKDKGLYPFKMTSASFEALKDARPEERPWIYSRSGCPGIQRLARTWTGDNYSDWKTLKFNQYQGWGLGLSCVPFYGHDLGGFFGPMPGRELLLRSCQTGVFQPRFVIHSWNEGGDPRSPGPIPAPWTRLRIIYRNITVLSPISMTAPWKPPKKRYPWNGPCFLNFPRIPDAGTKQFIQCLARRY